MYSSSVFAVPRLKPKGRAMLVLLRKSKASVPNRPAWLLRGSFAQNGVILSAQNFQLFAK
jgi:hypothetical protein